ncbi:MAG: N-acetylmuramoyl-L-alanine amidase [Sumerlaeia bacterium]
MRWKPLNLLVLFFLVGLLPGLAGAARVSEVRLAEHPGFTRCVIEMDAEPQYSVGNMSRQANLVTIMLAGVTSAPSSAHLSGVIEQIQDTSIEHSERLNACNVHLRTRGTVRVETQRLQSPWRVVIDLYPEGATPPAETPSATAAPTATPTAAPEPAPASEVPPPLVREIGGRYRPRTIIIDPGHGGRHRGGLGELNGRTWSEAEITLPIGFELHRLLAADPLFKPVLTRTKDEYIGLRERTRIAEQNRGDLFLSIHLNAVAGNAADRRRARGLEFYTWSYDSSDKKPWKYLVNLENEVDEGPGIRRDALPLLNGMLRDALETQSTESQRVARGLEQAFLQDTFFRKDYRGIKDARFKVLENYDMPSVLIEVCFITNPDELRWISSAERQKRVARYIYEGTLRYYEAHDPQFRAARGAMLAKN